MGDSYSYGCEYFWKLEVSGGLAVIPNCSIAIPSCCGPLCSRNKLGGQLSPRITQWPWPQLLPVPHFLPGHDQGSAAVPEPARSCCWCLVWTKGQHLYSGALHAAQQPRIGTSSPGDFWPTYFKVCFHRLHFICCLKVRLEYGKGSAAYSSLSNSLSAMAQKGQWGQLT